MKNYALGTGSSDRIGKSVAIHLAKEGYNIILHYNSSVKKAQKVKDEIESLKNKVKVELLQINFLENNDFDKIFKELKKDTTIISN